MDSQGGTGFRGGVCLRVWFHVNGAAKRSQPGSRAGRIRAFHVERGERRAVQPGLSGQNGGVPRGTQVCGAARGPIEDRPCEGSHQRILRFSGQFFWFHVERSPASAQLRYLRASESGVPRGTWTETSGLPLDDSPFGVRVGSISQLRGENFALFHVERGSAAHVLANFRESEGAFHVERGVLRREAASAMTGHAGG